MQPETFRAFIKHHGLTTESLADKLDVSRQHVNNIIRRNEIVPQEIIKACADLLKVTETELAEMFREFQNVLREPEDVYKDMYIKALEENNRLLKKIVDLEKQLLKSPH